MRITPAQAEAFRAQSTLRFRRDLESLLVRSCSASTAVVELNVGAHVDRNLMRAQIYGLKTEQEISSFVLATALLPGVEADPQVLEVLTGSDGPTYKALFLDALVLAATALNGQA